MAKAKLLSKGDVIKTNPFDGYWGCAVVLTERDKTDEFHPMSHIGITSTVFTHDYDFCELPIHDLEILKSEQQIRVGVGTYAPLGTITCICMYTRKANPLLKVIGNIDVSPLVPKPLKFVIGDGLGKGWPLGGPIPDRLGSEAVNAWRMLNDTEQALKDFAEASRSHEAMLVRLAEEDRLKRAEAKRKKKDTSR